MEEIFWTRESVVKYCKQCFRGTEEPSLDLLPHTGKHLSLSESPLDGLGGLDGWEEDLRLRGFIFGKVLLIWLVDRI